MGISLWLVPTVSQAVKLKRFMTIKSQSARSTSSFVDFDPHLTLVTIPASPTAASELREAIATEQVALPVSFKSVDVGDKYFMSVYAVAHESERLARLRTHLREKFGEFSVPPIPHLSLYYIDDADRDERARVAEELKSSGRVIDRAGRVSLNCAEDLGKETCADILDGFDGEAIWIVKCEGPVSEWQVLQRIGLVINEG